MKHEIVEAAEQLRRKGSVATPSEIADLAGLFKDVSEEKCGKLMDDMDSAFASVLNIDRLESFDGEIMTPSALAVLLQSPNISSRQAGDMYEIIDENTGDVYKVCVTQVELVNGNVCSYASISVAPSRAGNSVSQSSE